jgi:uncharacterized protein
LRNVAYPNGQNKILFHVEQALCSELWNQKVIFSVGISPPSEAGEHTVKISSVFYFIFVFVLSIPFYILGANGAKLFGLSILPASALMVIVPAIAAVILVYQQGGVLAVVELLKSTCFYERNLGQGWISAALLFMPVVFVLEFGIMWVTSVAVPLPKIDPSQIPFLFLIFFIGAICEEAGWQGYAYPALRGSFSVLRAAVVLGAVWGIWHIIPFVQQGRSANWVLWQCLCAVAMRIIIVWLFENTRKSILIAVLFHMMFNVSWALFPVAGSFYDPFMHFLILVFPVIAIVALWRPKMKFAKIPS